VVLNQLDWVLDTKMWTTLRTPATLFMLSPEFFFFWIAEEQWTEPFSSISNDDWSPLASWLLMFLLRDHKEEFIIVLYSQ